MTEPHVQRIRDYAIRAIGHTGITVSDIRKSCAFYRDILGLQVSEPVRASGAMVSIITGVPDAELEVAFVRCPGHVLELLCFLQPAHRTASSLRTCDPGFVHVCFNVTRLDEVIAGIRAGGFEAVGAVQTFADGPAAGMRVVYTRDPDGVVLEFAEEPPGVTFEDLFLGPVAT